MERHLKLLVYTCVFGGYDRIFPPVAADPAIDYVVVTDQPGLSVRGWKTRHVDPAGFGTSRLANRHYKLLGHEHFPEYDCSVYVDGNIRVVRRTGEFLRAFMESGAALGLYRHPLRSSVAEEVAQCAKAGKIADHDAGLAELRGYQAEGFPDSQGLIEASIVLRNHRHPELREAMRLWWDLFDKYRSRDQFSLPFVLWRTAVPCMLIGQSFRESNPYFGWYPHVGSGVASPAYVRTAAKSHGNIFHRLLLRVWHLKWRLQRLARGAK